MRIVLGPPPPDLAQLQQRLTRALAELEQHRTALAALQAAYDLGDPINRDTVAGILAGVSTTTGSTP